MFTMALCVPLFSFAVAACVNNLDSVGDYRATEYPLVNKPLVVQQAAVGRVLLWSSYTSNCQVLATCASATTANFVVRDLCPRNFTSRAVCRWYLLTLWPQRYKHRSHLLTTTVIFHLICFLPNPPNPWPMNPAYMLNLRYIKPIFWSDSASVGQTLCFQRTACPLQGLFVCGHEQPHQHAADSGQFHRCRCGTIFIS
jgi:hypothetical protein